MTFRRVTARLHVDDVAATAKALDTCADHAETMGATRAVSLVRSLRVQLFDPPPPPEPIEVLRVINCMAFTTYLRLVGEPADTNSFSDYWGEKFSDSKGNPFALLCDLDGERRARVWEWAEEEWTRQAISTGAGTYRPR